LGSKAAIVSLMVVVVVVVMALWAAEIVLLSINECRAWMSREYGGYWRNATFELGIRG
jgi:hypothetical protein